MSEGASQMKITKINPAKIFWPLIFLLLSGCASLHGAGEMQTLPKQTWAVRSQQLSQLKNFQAQGVLSVYYRKKLTIANFAWQQMGDRYQIKLSGPWGLGSEILMGQPGRVTLIRSSHERYTAVSPEVLLSQQLGLHLPVTALIFWARGIPAPLHPTQIKFNDLNQIICLKQAGWLIELSQYRVVKTATLPTKLQINSKQLKLRIVVNKWKI